MRIYSFGPFTLNVGRFELRRKSETLRLPRVPMELLILLIERRGDLVSRLELADRIWAGADPEEVKPSINNAINRLRYTLRDKAEDPVYIQTVIGKGYQFIALVQVSEAEAVTPPGEAAVAIPEPKPDLPPIPVEPAHLIEPGESPQTAHPGAPAWRLPLRIILGAVVLLTFAGAVLHWVLPSRAARQDKQERPFTLTRLTDNSSSAWVTAAAISHDGSVIAVAEPNQIRLLSRSGAEMGRIPAPDLRVVDRIAWFADDSQMLVSGLSRSSGVPEVWLFSRRGAQPIRMRTDARLGMPSPSGQQIAFASGSLAEVWVMDIAGQPHRLLKGAADVSYTPLAWTEGGHTLLVERLQDDARVAAPSWDPAHGVNSTLLAVDAATGETRTSIADLRLEDAVCLPHSQLLYTRRKGDGVDVWRVPIDPQTGAFQSPPRLLQETHIRGLTAADDGTLAGLVVRVTPQVVVATLERNPLRLAQVQPLTAERYSAYPHAWSADGLSVYVEQNRDDHWEILRQPPGAAPAVALMNSRLNQSAPRLTADHRWLLFAGREPGTGPSQLFSVSVEGGQPHLLHAEGPESDFRCPLQQGKCLLRRPDNLNSLLFLPVDPITGVGSAPKVQLPWAASSHLGDWDISPDGRRLILTSAVETDPVLDLVDLATGRVEHIPIAVHRTITAVNWSADAKGWFLALANGRGSDLIYATRDQPPVLLRQTTSGTFAIPSGDGRRLAFVDQSIDSNVWLLQR